MKETFKALLSNMIFFTRFVLMNTSEMELSTFQRKRASDLQF